MEYIGNVLYDDLFVEDRKFIIYGTGIFGKKLYLYFKKCGYENKVIYFCDRDIQDGVFLGVKVIYPLEAVRVKNADFLVGGKYDTEMIDFLLDNGVEKIHLLWF